MKSEIDSLMQERDLDALLITGPAQHNPAMYYFTGGVHLGNADLIKKRGEAPVLFYNSMERDEAASTGLRTRNLGSYSMMDLLKANGGDYAKALGQRYQLMLKDLGITGGRVAIYGKTDIGSVFASLSALQTAMPEIHLVGEMGNTLLLQAMSTKDSSEVERIRRMGKITTQVVGQVAEMLSLLRAKDGVLVKDDGKPITIGEIKTLINLWLVERGAENPHGTIFAIGRDAGVPHSTGKAQDVLRLGETIVFDIYPCEAGGGYHYDFTRTWCLGYAPDAVQALYDDVRQVFDHVRSSLEANTAFKDYQDLTCELFESRGHRTIHSHPQTEEGYVHSLGHGLGLQVHERPISGSMAGEADRLFPGVVVTVEPGLYYPERGMGVRIEDTVWVRPDGVIETLADYPYDLVIPVK